VVNKFACRKIRFIMISRLFPHSKSAGIDNPQAEFYDSSHSHYYFLKTRFDSVHMRTGGPFDESDTYAAAVFPLSGIDQPSLHSRFFSTGWRSKATRKAA
jgi:hypothetical protein